MHCIGMCGPLVLAASGQTLVNSSRTFNFIMYHVGRILIYACFGFIMGLFGLGIHISGLQKYFSILLGIFIIILAL